MKTWIKGGRLLLPDGAGFCVEEGDIVVENERISRVCIRGRSEEDLRGQTFDRILDASGKLVMPGLINAHTHAYMSLFRNYADDLEFFDWLARVQAVEDRLTAEHSYWATMLSIIEMLHTGTTSFVDMYMHSCVKGSMTGTGTQGAVCGAVRDSGIRGFMSRGLVGASGDPGSLRRFGEFFPEIELHKDHDTLTFLFGPHAPYSCRQSLLKEIRDLGAERHMMAVIHIAESEAECADMAREHGGITPVQYVEQSGLFDLPVIAAHCVKVNAQDIRILKEHNVSVAINPRSNMKLGNGFAPVPEMMKAGLNICLGTDGSGSNNTQNMFQEMNMAALVYKGAAGQAKCVDAADVLRFATTGGARALGMEHQLGVLAPGALADIILVDLHVPQFVPQNDLVSALVYSANGSEVRTVMVNGRILMEDGRIRGIDEERVFRMCEDITRSLGMHQ